MDNELLLIAPQSYYNMTEEQKHQICNGCGAPDLKMPNKLFGLSILEACYIHDYMYNIGRTTTDKNDADLIFLYNLFILIERGTSNRFLRWLRRKSAMTYYFAVNSIGIFRFIDGKTEYYTSMIPDTMTRRIHEFQERTINNS